MCGGQAPAGYEPDTMRKLAIALTLAGALAACGNATDGTDSGSNTVGEDNVPAQEEEDRKP